LFSPIDKCIYSTVPCHVDLLYNNNKKGNAHFLKVLGQKIDEEKITSINKWHNKLNVTFNKVTWQHIFSLNYHAIEDNYYKWFSYKILHRILGTKYLMNKMNIFDNPTCRLCLQDPETLQHLFVDCNKTKLFWTELIGWIKNISNVTIPFDKITILFGCLLRTSDQKAINTILILAKNYIFLTAYFNNRLYLSIFKKKFIKIYFEQYNLAIFKDKEEAFEKAWLKFQPLIDDIVESDD